MAKPILYLTKPKIKGDNLEYVRNNKEIYVNLFQIILKLLQYPYSISPEVDASDLRIRRKLFKSIGEKKDKKKLRDFYGECFISGDSLYGTNEVKESKSFLNTNYI